jgi:hypothetical protein
MPSATHSSAPDVGNPLALVKLTTLMERTSGNPEVKIGLIDGPVAIEHPDLGRRARSRNSGTSRRVM